MIEFDDAGQKAKLDHIREKEEEELAKILSQKYGVQYVDLSRTPINTDALRIVSEDEARSAKLVVFGQVDKKLDVAVLAPESDKTKKVLESISKRGFVPTVYMTSQAGLDLAWKRYKDLSFATVTKEGVLDVSNDEIRQYMKDIRSLSDAMRIIEETLALKKSHRVSRIVEIFLATGMATGASDVHIEPEEGSVRLRFRVDGILTNVTNFDHDTYQLLLSRIKLLSGLKLNVKKDSQDGRFSIVLDDAEVEIRTSTIPGAYGESVVMRILNPNAISVDLDNLGMEPRLLHTVLQEIEKPNGMVLSTGPTGSGKTTTLYAILKRVLRPEIKIITIEDPIEYHLPGVVQTQTREQEGYTFSQGLRSAVRQDPDIIMVGEIRDPETASIAINASLTGHLVFSTLHTNSAAGTFPRLVDLGVDPKIIPSAVSLSIAQRLVRKLCPSCKKEAVIEGEMLKKVERVLADLPEHVAVEQKNHVWEPDASCADCVGGYSGRIGIFEAIRTDEAIEMVIRQNPSDREIAEAARPQGGLTMIQDGVLKALAGKTSLSEVERVLTLDV